MKVTDLAPCLSGYWTNLRGKRVVIQDNFVHWDSGAPSTVSMSENGKLCMDLDGATYLAELVGGRLVWDDGDVWTPTVCLGGAWTNPEGEQVMIQDNLVHWEEGAPT